MKSRHQITLAMRCGFASSILVIAAAAGPVLSDFDFTYEWRHLPSARKTPPSCRRSRE
jgi:hypothetical protein